MQHFRITTGFVITSLPESSEIEKPTLFWVADAKKLLLMEIESLGVCDEYKAQAEKRVVENIYPESEEVFDILTRVTGKFHSRVITNGLILELLLWI